MKKVSNKVHCKKKEFSVIVVATMSAGKSTFINALLGAELLHSANEATTATITRIQDKKNTRAFEGGCFSPSGDLIDYAKVVDASLLQAWNASHDVKSIDLIGNIKTIRSLTSRLVIYDTPGPNNSQDVRHELLTMEVIHNHDYECIVYLLDATQLGIHDDLSLLKNIKIAISKDIHKKIIFVLNKVDLLDQEKGEHLSDYVNAAEQYLKNIGFDNPIIIPAMVGIALSAKKLLQKQKLSRSEKGNFIKNYQLYKENSYYLIEGALIDDAHKKYLRKSVRLKRLKGNVELFGEVIPRYELSQFISFSGIRALKTILESYLVIQ